ncbi:uncharacterized protein LOC114279667 [Camellia sinensis]|uniref:uncharacterized protein LOC114279667 n=1 Tax=Camellia sinensis TaxID=4442 RepID=UPI0010356AE2|nr:uncharacterized protein LOC114279667 [Camellia sinensis]
MERKHDGLEREFAFSLETTLVSRVYSFNISLMMADYSSDLHDLDTMGDKLVIEGTTTTKGSSHILKDSLSDSDLLILMDIAKRNGGKKHCSASDIEMGRSPKASIGVESEIPSPSSFVDAIGGFDKCSAIVENPLQMNGLPISVYAPETVGCVVVDGEGRCAAATSTSGLMNKMSGRIGDSPLIGAGTYACEVCGVSCTGEGEAIIRGTLARDVAAVMEYKGLGLQEAVDY